jgi:hypothetical protein
MYQKIKLFITTALETSNPAFLNAIQTDLGQPRYWTSSSQGVYIHQLKNTWTLMLPGGLEPQSQCLEDPDSATLNLAATDNGSIENTNKKNSMV